MEKLKRTREEVRTAFKAFMRERDAEQKSAQKRGWARRQKMLAEVL